MEARAAVLLSIFFAVGWALMEVNAADNTEDPEAAAADDAAIRWGHGWGSSLSCKALCKVMWPVHHQEEEEEVQEVHFQEEEEEEVQEVQGRQEEEVQEVPEVLPEVLPGLPEVLPGLLPGLPGLRISRLPTEVRKDPGALHFIRLCQAFREVGQGLCDAPSDVRVAFHELYEDARHQSEAVEVEREIEREIAFEEREEREKLQRLERRGLVEREREIQREIQLELEKTGQALPLIPRYSAPPPPYSPPYSPPEIDRREIRCKVEWQRGNWIVPGLSIFFFSGIVLILLISWSLKTQEKPGKKLVF